MRVPRIYVAAPLPHRGEVTLPVDTAHYLGNVLRMTAGREVRLFDGSGSEFVATLTAVSKKAATAEIDHHHPCATESQLQTQLILGISRGERMDYALQKAVELGASRISPAVTERSEVKLSGDRADKKWAHWHAVVVSAAEQSGRVKLPTLDHPALLSQAVQQSTCELKLVLAPGGAGRLSQFAAPASVTLVAGPEGGLSDPELALCQSAGFIGIGLGPRILRTETAPVAALTAAQLLWGDLAR